MAISIVATLLFDGDPEVQHSLISGMGVQPGGVRVTKVQTDLNVPMAASIISNDEETVLPGVPAAPSGAGPFLWEFDWDSVPEIGIDATLRLEEISPPGISATVNVTLNFLGAFEENPFPPTLPQPITIQIGAPPGP